MVRSTLFRATVAAVVVFVIACTQKTTPPPAAVPPDSAAIRAELDQVWSAFRTGLMAGNAAQTSGIFADEARLDFAAYPPIVGKAAVEKMMQDDLAAQTYSDWSVAVGRTTVYDSTHAAQHGSFSETARVKTGKADSVRFGRWAGGFIKEAGGWKIRYLIGFLDSTKAAPAPR